MGEGSNSSHRWSADRVLSMAERLQGLRNQVLEQQRLRKEEADRYNVGRVQFAAEISHLTKGLRACNAMSERLAVEIAEANRIIAQQQAALDAYRNAFGQLPADTIFPSADQVQQ